MKCVNQKIILILILTQEKISQSIAVREMTKIRYNLLQM